MSRLFSAICVRQCSPIHNFHTAISVKRQIISKTEISNSHRQSHPIQKRFTIVSTPNCVVFDHVHANRINARVYDDIWFVFREDVRHHAWKTTNHSFTSYNSVPNALQNNWNEPSRLSESYVQPGRQIRPQNSTFQLLDVAQSYTNSKFERRYRRNYKRSAHSRILILKTFPKCVWRVRQIDSKFTVGSNGFRHQVAINNWIEFDAVIDILQANSLYCPLKSETLLKPYAPRIVPINYWNTIHQQFQTLFINRSQFNQ